MMDIFDDEYIYEIHDYNVRKETERKMKIEVKKEVEREVKKEANRETAERLIKGGKMPLEEILDYVPSLSLNELQEIEKSVMQPE